MDTARETPFHGRYPSGGSDVDLVMVKEHNWALGVYGLGIDPMRLIKLARQRQQEKDKEENNRRKEKDRERREREREINNVNPSGYINLKEAVFQKSGVNGQNFANIMNGQQHNNIQRRTVTLQIPVADDVGDCGPVTQRVTYDISVTKPGPGNCSNIVTTPKSTSKNGKPLKSAMKKSKYSSDDSVTVGTQFLSQVGAAGNYQQHPQLQFVQNHTNQITIQQLPMPMAANTIQQLCQLPNPCSPPMFTPSDLTPINESPIPLITDDDTDFLISLKSLQIGQYTHRYPYVDPYFARTIYVFWPRKPELLRDEKMQILIEGWIHDLDSVWDHGRYKTGPIHQTSIGMPMEIWDIICLIAATGSVGTLDSISNVTTGNSIIHNNVSTGTNSISNIHNAISPGSVSNTVSNNKNLDLQTATGCGISIVSPTAIMPHTQYIPTLPNNMNSCNGQVNNFHSEQNLLLQQPSPILLLNQQNSSLKSENRDTSDSDERYSTESHTDIDSDGSDSNFKGDSDFFNTANRSPESNFRGQHLPKSCLKRASPTNSTGKPSCLKKISQFPSAYEAGYGGKDNRNREKISGSDLTNKKSKGTSRSSKSKKKTQPQIEISTTTTYLPFGNGQSTGGKYVFSPLSHTSPISETPQSNPPLTSTPLSHQNLKFSPDGKLTMSMTNQNHDRTRSNSSDLNNLNASAEAMYTTNLSNSNNQPFRLTGLTATISTNSNQSSNLNRAENSQTSNQDPTDSLEKSISMIPPVDGPSTGGIRSTPGNSLITSSTPGPNSLITSGPSNNNCNNSTISPYLQDTGNSNGFAFDTLDGLLCPHGIIRSDSGRDDFFSGNCTTLPYSIGGETFLQPLRAPLPQAPVEISWWGPERSDTSTNNINKFSDGNSNNSCRITNLSGNNIFARTSYGDEITSEPRTSVGEVSELFPSQNGVNGITPQIEISPTTTYLPSRNGTSTGGKYNASSIALSTREACALGKEACRIRLPEKKWLEGKRKMVERVFGSRERWDKLMRETENSFIRNGGYTIGYPDIKKKL